MCLRGEVKMNLELKIYGALCETSTFVINNINADHDDFGTKEDRDPENAEDYGCGNMQFRGRAETKEVLEKYSISSAEYADVVRELEDGLSFGNCGLCV